MFCACSVCICVYKRFDIYVLCIGGNEHATQMFVPLRVLAMCEDPAVSSEDGSGVGLVWVDVEDCRCASQRPSRSMKCRR